jgi:DNA-binding response OmpR family regulator
MRVLVVADDETRRASRLAALERIETPAVGGVTVARVAAEVRATSPDVVLIDGLGSTEARQVLERARRAAERPLAALLLLAEGMTWLRTPLPPDLLPAAVLASAGVEDRELQRALASLQAGGVPSGSLAAHELRLDPRALEASNARGSAPLTPSEAKVLEALMVRPSTVVRIEEIARSLYGNPLSDPRTRATIHGHVATLRRKLATIGADGQVEALRAVGYRLVERRGRAMPPARPRPPR